MTFRFCRLPPPAAFVLTLPATALAAPVAFDLPAQALVTSLKAVASAGGLNLAVDGTLLDGKGAPALQGQFETADALRHLLAGSGLTVTISGNTAVVTPLSGEIELEKVAVQAPNLTSDQQLQREGAADQGYLVQTTRGAGPIWGDMKLQDAPYTITDIPAALIDNSGAYDTEQLAKFLPQITGIQPTQNQNGESVFYIRGTSIQPSVPFNASGGQGGGTVDGLMGTGGVGAMGLEDKERVELFTGADGFMTGIGSISGNLNYVLKRPTADPLYEITTGSTTGGAGEYIHGDFGGPISDKLGYRLNVVESNGDTGITNQTINRYLVSGAFDLHMTDDWLVQVNGSNSDYRVRGTTPDYILSDLKAAAKLPASSWSYYEEEDTQAGIRTSYKFFDAVTARVAYTYSYQHTPVDTTTYYSALRPNGNVNQSISAAAEDNNETSAGYGFLDWESSLWNIQNKLTVGFTGVRRQQFLGGGPKHGASQICNVNNDTCNNLGEPSLTYSNLSTSLADIGIEKNRVFADQVTYGPVTLMGGITYTTVGSSGYSRGVEGKTSGVTDGAWTPTTSVSYKIMPWLTSYATYLESLQPGELVGSTYSGLPVTNAGAILPPYVGHDEEGGFKATVPGLKNFLVTLDYFNNDRAYHYADLNNDNNTYTVGQSGTVTDAGFELMMTGKVTDDVTVIGGVTELITAKIRNNTANPSLNGTWDTGVAKESAKIYVEWDQPWLRGLTLIGDTSWTTGSMNNTKDNVTDLGVRYTHDIYGTTTIWRFNVNNVTNATYWADTYYLGAPRSFIGTVTVKF